MENVEHPTQEPLKISAKEKSYLLAATNDVYENLPHIAILLKKLSKTPAKKSFASLRITRLNRLDPDRFSIDHTEFMKTYKEECERRKKENETQTSATGYLDTLNSDNSNRLKKNSAIIIEAYTRFLSEHFAMFGMQQALNRSLKSIFQKYSLGKDLKDSLTAEINDRMQIFYGEDVAKVQQHGAMELNEFQLKLINELISIDSSTYLNEFRENDVISSIKKYIISRVAGNDIDTSLSEKDSTNHIYINRDRAREEETSFSHGAKIHVGFDINDRRLVSFLQAIKKAVPTREFKIECVGFPVFRSKFVTVYSPSDPGKNSSTDIDHNFRTAVNDAKKIDAVLVEAGIILKQPQPEETDILVGESGLVSMRYGEYVTHLPSNYPEWQDDRSRDFKSNFPDPKGYDAFLKIASEENLPVHL